MSALPEITPKEQNRIIDLVRNAGVDVSDWSNVRGGEKNAASNPKYCYEWSFIEPKKLVVLNLWFSSMEEKDGTVLQHINFRHSAKNHRKSQSSAVWKKRATKVDLAIQTAWRDKLPIRVVVCEGNRRDSEVEDAEASNVDLRLLDPMSWAVTYYDWESGECVVTRGAEASPYVDQFILQKEISQEVERRATTGEVYVRSGEVRKRVLLRAKGKCELCGQPGFSMKDGRIFLETHHIIPLSEKGVDTVENVAALCPNHHREAHYGLDNATMQKDLLERLVQKKRI